MEVRRKDMCKKKGRQRKGWSERRSEGVRKRKGRGN